jgi:hypothetical protein
MKKEQIIELIPYTIISFMIFTTIVNQDFAKGGVWLVILILGFFIIPHIFYKSNLQQTPCSFIYFAEYYQSCSTSSFTIMYTFVYLLLSMLQVNHINYSVIAVFIFLYFSDILGRQNINNYVFGGTFTGTLVGALWGVLGYWAAYSIGGNKLLFFSSNPSTNEYCSRPKKQQFKCSVYKNGQIISTI